MVYVHLLIFIFAKTCITLYRICFHFSYNGVSLDEIFCNIVVHMIAQAHLYITFTILFIYISGSFLSLHFMTRKE